jgi:ABC-type transport system involved in multi-copper enzyme maturation permease subunit
MPVYEQTYPTWTRRETSRVRWWPIVRRELQLLVTQRPFVMLLVVAALPTLIHLLQLYSVNKLAADPHGEVARALRNLAVTVDATFFFQFLQVQMYFVFLLLLYASSGLVCDDLRLNLVEVYFSKPLTVRDYLLGKVVTIGGLGLVYTALPALFLFVAHAMMTPQAGFLRAHAWVPLASVAFSVVIVVPITVCTLACSALTSSRGFAAAAVVALLAADAFSATLLAEILDLRAANIINVPAAMLRVGEALFGARPYIPLGWPWALGVVVAVTAVGLVVLVRRVRGVEVGS